MAYSKPGSCADLDPKKGKAVVRYIYREKKLILPMILAFAIGKRTEAAWPDTPAQQTAAQMPMDRHSRACGPALLLANVPCKRSTTAHAGVSKNMASCDVSAVASIHL